MAVWQADFSVRVNRPLPDGYDTSLDSIAPRSHQLWPGNATWGSQDGNRLDLHLEDGQPTEGLLRLDLRAWDPVFVEGMLGLLLRWGTTLVGPQGQTVEPVLGEVALAVRGSPAFRFVESPEHFLRRLRFGGLEDA